MIPLTPARETAKIGCFKNNFSTSIIYPKIIRNSRTLFLWVWIFFSSLVLPVCAQNYTAIDQLLMHEEYRGAISEIEKALLADSLQTGLYVRYSTACRALDYCPKAAAKLEKASVLLPSELLIWYELGKNYADMNYTGKAIQAFEKVIGLDSAYTQAWRNIALLYRRQNDFTSALNAYSVLHKQDTTNSFYLQQMGNCAFTLNDTVNAIEYTSKALQVSPKDFNSLYQLADIYQRSDKKHTALSLVDYALKQDSTHLAFRRKKASLHFEIKQYTTALEQYNYLFAIADTSANNYKLAGIAAYNLELFDSAKVLLEKAVRLDKKDHISVYYLGLNLRELKQDKASVYYLQKAVELLVNPPMAANYYGQLAQSEYNNGSAQKALQAYQAALMLDPSNSDVLFRMAMLYDYDFKQSATALDLYEKVRKITTNPLTLAVIENRVKALNEDMHFNAD